MPSLTFLASLLLLYMACSHNSSRHHNLHSFMCFSHLLFLSNVVCHSSAIMSEMPENIKLLLLIRLGKLSSRLCHRANIISIMRLKDEFLFTPKIAFRVYWVHGSVKWEGNRIKKEQKEEKEKEKKNVWKLIFKFYHLRDANVVES